MKEILAVPYHYLNEVGLKESVFFSYLILKNNLDEANIPSFVVNKSQIKEKGEINFLTAADITAAIDALFNIGFVFIHKKFGKKTKEISLNVMNVLLFEFFGMEKYKSMLIEYDTNRYSGKYIPYDYLNTDGFKIPDFPSMFGKGGYINIGENSEHTPEIIIEIIKSVYRFDVRNIDKHISGNSFIPFDDGEDFPVNIESMFMYGFSNLMNGVKIPYYEAVNSGCDFQIGDDFVVKKDEESNSEPEIPSLKDLARNNVMKYYEYMQISATMKKVIMEWNARDFVSYLYCGLAKIGEEEGNFIFPDFKRDTARIKKLMDKYGNKRLNKVIYNMVKRKDEMVEFCKLKDFNPSLATLSVDWIFEKMLTFVHHIEHEDSITELRKQIAENNSVEDDKDDSEKENLKNETDGSNLGNKLNELRNTFNQNKEKK